MGADTFYIFDHFPLCFNGFFFIVLNSERKMEGVAENNFPQHLANNKDNPNIFQNMDNKWNNFTEETISKLNKTFPNINIDIPGFTDVGDGEPSTNFAIFMCSLIFAIF